MPTEPEFYPRPYFGQPFKLVQNEHNIEYGAVTGLKYTAIDPEGKVLSWTACITSTTTANGFRFYHNTPMNKTGGWMPLSAEEIAEMRRVAGVKDPTFGDIVAMGRSVETLEQARVALEERLLIAESKLVEANREFARLHERINAFAHPAPEAADASPSAPPPQQTNGRPTRVAPAGRA